MPKIDLILEAAQDFYGTITLDLSAQLAKRYNEGHFDLAQLDNWRLVELPQIIAERYKEEDNAWLTKGELVLLMDWKLAKGKFRPTLPKLIMSNSEQEVERISREGFNILLELVKNEDGSFWKNPTVAQLAEYTDAVKNTIKAFSQLRGVGPATASLILSLITRINESLAPPFFSDESFLYYVVDRSRPGSKIKYNIKEYIEELLPVYFDILRYNPFATFGALERGAWALKTYQILRVTTLADVKALSEYDEKFLNSFDVLKEEEKDGKEGKKRVKPEAIDKRKKQKK